MGFPQNQEGTATFTEPKLRHVSGEETEAQRWEETAPDHALSQLLLRNKVLQTQRHKQRLVALLQVSGVIFLVSAGSLWCVGSYRLGTWFCGLQPTFLVYLG